MAALLDEINDRLERLEWVVQQDIALADDLEHVRALFLQHARHAGRKSGEFQVIARHLLRDAHQPHQVDRAIHAVQVAWLQHELPQQEIGHLLGAVIGDFQPHGVAEVAVRQLALQADAQVFYFFVIHEQIAVARDAELVAAQHLHAAEQLSDMRVQDGRQEHEAVLAAADFLRQRDGARQHARRLHDGFGGIAPEGVLALQLHGEVEALVEHPREGVRRVQPDGGQHRHHFPEEKFLDPGALRFVPEGAAQEADTFPLQRGQQIAVENAVLPLDELVRLPVYQFQRLLRIHAVRPGGSPGHAELLFQAGDADLEELVQVAADDAQVLQPLQQRDGGILRLRQHAPVKFQLPQLAVEEVLGGEFFAHCGYLCGGT
ncbi:MAG: Uncharacterized protein FD134_1116 [Gallionellaceae bacterium]|nr:MAG: Uncharacterized protein FD134_1116 [Gallionellaceae bacterium]